jgi:hypothetical protein
MHVHTYVAIGVSWNTVVRGQGDQIGRILASCVSVYSGMFFGKLLEWPIPN